MLNNKIKKIMPAFIGIVIAVAVNCFLISNMSLGIKIITDVVICFIVNVLFSWGKKNE